MASVDWIPKYGDIIGLKFETQKMIFVQSFSNDLGNIKFCLVSRNEKKKILFIPSVLYYWEEFLVLKCLIDLFAYQTTPFIVDILVPYMP